MQKSISSSTVLKPHAHRLAGGLSTLLLWLILSGALSPAHGQPWLAHPLDNSLVNSLHVDVADLNGDDALDIIATGGRSHNVVWYENRHPAWTRRLIDSNLQNAGGLGLADLNGDQHIDVIVGAVPYILWYEAPDWSEHIIHPGPSVGWNQTLVVADLNNDNTLDVVCTDWANLVWFEGPAWTRNVIEADVGDPGEIALADLDGDADLDVIFSEQGDWQNPGTGAMTWYEAPDWTAHSITTTLSWGYGVKTADMDGDDDLDVVAATPVVWYENPSWEMHLVETERDSAFGVTLADMDDDNNVDVIATYWSDSPELVWYKAPEWQMQVISNDLPGALDVVTADIDGDGDQDVIANTIVGDDFASTVVLYENRRIAPGIIDVPGDQPTIQAGIDAASDGDTVLVAEGTYYENINFKGKAITVASHFLLDNDSTHKSNTIIDGSQPADSDSGSVVYFVSGEDTNSVLTGFTITGGSGTLLRGGASRTGGGIFVSAFRTEIASSGAKITHNIIEHNAVRSAGNAGGGGITVASDAYDYTIIKENTIRDNVVEGVIALGGGIRFRTDGRISRNIIRNNRASHAAAGWAGGGGISCWGRKEELKTVTITSNVITGNGLTGRQSESVGAGCMIGYLAPGSRVTDNTISHNDNNATLIKMMGGAGGLLIYNCEKLLFDRNRVIANEAQVGGGIMCQDSDAIIQNNIIARNRADFFAGMGFVSATGLTDPPVIINNTIAGNVAAVSGGGMMVENWKTIVFNSIIWDNRAPASAQIHFLGGGSMAIAHSDIEGGWDGEGNVDQDPLFVDTLSYQLAGGSPCLGNGVESLQIEGVRHTCPSHDHNGDSRPRPPGSDPDMGAVESPLATDIEAPVKTVIPERYHLAQNYPNPFNPATSIRYALPVGHHVTLTIHNLLGEELSILVDERQQAGQHTVRFDAGNLPGGVYFYTIKAGEFKRTCKMILLK